MAIERVLSLKKILLKGVWHEILSFKFFHESFYSETWSIPVMQFRICTKIRGDIRNFEFIAGVADTGENTMTRIFINHWSLLYHR